MQKIKDSGGNVPEGETNDLDRNAILAAVLEQNKKPE